MQFTISHRSYVRASFLIVLFALLPRLTQAQEDVYERIRRQAVEGDAYSQALLSLALIQGDREHRNPAEARMWAEKAVAQNHPLGFYLLASLYDEGIGIQRNRDSAMKLYRRALPGLKSLAEDGNALAQNELGLIYLHGRGVTTDTAEAARWLTMAAAQEIARAQNQLAKLYVAGRRYADAAKWFRQAAEQGDAKGQYYLGLCYLDGVGLEQDDAEAVRWLRRSAEQGEVSAQYNLGLAYLNGRGVEQNKVEAVRWLRRSAEQGDASAQGNLGVIYLTGNGVEHDMAEALKWLRRSAEQGNPPAAYMLAMRYIKGDGVEKDLVQGYALLSMAKKVSQGVQRKSRDREIAEIIDKACSEMDDQLSAEQKKRAEGLTAQLLAKIASNSDD